MPRLHIRTNTLESLHTPRRRHKPHRTISSLDLLRMTTAHHLCLHTSASLMLLSRSQPLNNPCTLSTLALNHQSLCECLDTASHLHCPVTLPDTTPPTTHSSPHCPVTFPTQQRPLHTPHTHRSHKGGTLGSAPEMSSLTCAIVLTGSTHTHLRWNHAVRPEQGFYRLYASSFTKASHGTRVMTTSSLLFVATT